MDDLHKIRANYDLGNLTKEDLLKSPLDLFKKWLEDAVKVINFDANAFVLSTVRDNVPDARVMLIKGVEGESLRFFTNYNSSKGKDIALNPVVSMVFFWKELQRQVRIAGVIQKCSKSESDEYFYSRPRESQYGAMVSAQSTIIDGREGLDKTFTSYVKDNIEPKRPENWGGYDVKPSRIEFWQGGTNRLHDRFLYELKNDVWSVNRLSP